MTEVMLIPLKYEDLYEVIGNIRIATDKWAKHTKHHSFEVIRLAELKKKYIINNQRNNHN